MINLIAIAAILIGFHLIGVLIGQSIQANRYVSKLADAYNRGKEAGRSDAAAVFARQTMELDLGQPEGADTWMPGNRV